VLESVIILSTAFLLDIALGDPSYRAHPVRLIGRLATAFEGVFFRIQCTGYVGGCVFFSAMLLIIAAVFTGTRLGLGWIHPKMPFLWDVFILYSCIALRDLTHHALPISKALEKGDLAKAREAVQRIVSRNASVLDAHGVARAAVESVSESFVDGFLAPIFWFGAGAVAAAYLGLHSATFGLLCAVLYRTVNTLDSMVGYKNERYGRFGFVSAKADDALNFIPARLAVIPLFIAACCCLLSPISGLNVWFRDRLKSPSPNAGHAEAFAAGALGLMLNGPVAYSFGTCDKSWIGVGTPCALPHHIRKCTKLIFCAGVFSVGIETIILIIV
jgi:adenosylcobinamide-phosphate synthase